jgi:hypothetical protein
MELFCVSERAKSSECESEKKSAVDDMTMSIKLAFLALIHQRKKKRERETNKKESFSLSAISFINNNHTKFPDSFSFFAFAILLCVQGNRRALCSLCVFLSAKKKKYSNLFNSRESEKEKAMSVREISAN